MPTSPQPLFYETSKCVALYLDQSIRLQLFLRCPSFRCIHKNQVLRIRNLKLCPDNFEINETTYKLGILRRYTNGEAPEEIRHSNNAGGFQHDMDRYGIPISNEVVNETDAEIVERLEQRLQLPGVYHPRRFIEIIEILEEIQPIILQYHMRMNNEVPPFTHYLQLTTTTATAQKVERVEHRLTLNEVRDYILNKIFGLNSRKVQIQTLKIGPNGFEDMEEPISDLALQVFSHIGKEFLEMSRLAVSGNVVNVLANLKEVIDMAPPLLEFKLAYQPIPDDAIVESADLLNIAKRSTLRILSGRSNYHIHLHACFIDNEDLMFMMNEWNNNKSRAIRYYSIGFSQKLELKRFLNMFKSIPGAERGEIEEIRPTEFPDCIVIPLKNDTELNVFCQETEDEYCKKQYSWLQTYWKVVKIKVQPRGFADVLGAF
ncbi:hypothetical protein GCK72_004123 [Caenorhabditis remanei]|uniref:DUF38 domain-containing protein n=1 Tax=Caenorhabditis remanei TaxID=31234 RepID=A0A6A5HBH8_CAERE|nr:hypothetical protein GCK72_004123 [Caenorhabditis remanei]KAF1764176.1 hypothetical protein GCK72_004123 [Caenorhabditis remanei]